MAFNTHDRGAEKPGLNAAWAVLLSIGDICDKYIFYSRVPDPANMLKEIEALMDEIDFAMDDEERVAINKEITACNVLLANYQALPEEVKFVDDTLYIPTDLLTRLRVAYRHLRRIAYATGLLMPTKDGSSGIADVMKRYNLIKEKGKEEMKDANAA